MPEPELLIVEFCRDGGEIKRHLVASARVCGDSRPTAGERALLIAIRMLAERETLRPGDRLTVRARLSIHAARTACLRA